MSRFAVFLLLGLALGGCVETINGGEESVLERTIRDAARNTEASGEYEAAAGYWAKLYSSHSDDLETSLSYARALRLAQRYENALQILDRAAEQHGPSAELLSAKAKVMVQQRRGAKAAELLAQAIALQPEDWKLHSYLGVAYDTAGDYAAAGQAYAKALELSPDNPSVLNNLGLSRAQAGDLMGAQEAMERAAWLNSKDPRLRQNLALIYALQGKLDKAEALSRTDLDEQEVRENLILYRRLGGGAAASGR